MPGTGLKARMGLHRERLVVLDEVQLMPELFSALRPEIDAHRRPGRFLLLGSASGDLLRQSGESLAGRIAYLQLSPLLADEMLIARLMMSRRRELGFDFNSSRIRSNTTIVSLIE